MSVFVRSLGYFIQLVNAKRYITMRYSKGKSYKNTEISKKKKRNLTNIEAEMIIVMKMELRIDFISSRIQIVFNLKSQPRLMLKKARTASLRKCHSRLTARKGIVDNLHRLVSSSKQH